MDPHKTCSAVLSRATERDETDQVSSERETKQGTMLSRPHDVSGPLGDSRQARGLSSIGLSDTLT